MQPNNRSASVLKRKVSTNHFIRDFYGPASNPTIHTYNKRCHLKVTLDPALPFVIQTRHTLSQLRDTWSQP